MFHASRAVLDPAKLPRGLKIFVGEFAEDHVGVRNLSAELSGGSTMIQVDIGSVGAQFFLISSGQISLSYQLDAAGGSRAAWLEQRIRFNCNRPGRLGWCVHSGGSRNSRQRSQGCACRTCGHITEKIAS